MGFKKLSTVLAFDAPDMLIVSLVDQHFHNARCKCGEKRLLIASADPDTLKRNVSAFCPKCKAADKVAYSEKKGKQTHLYVMEADKPVPPKPAKPVVGESRWDDI